MVYEFYVKKEGRVMVGRTRVMSVVGIVYVNGIYSVHAEEFVLRYLILWGEMGELC